MHLRNVGVVRVSCVWAVALIFFRTRPQISFESREKCGEDSCPFLLSACMALAHCVPALQPFAPLLRKLLVRVKDVSLCHESTFIGSALFVRGQEPHPNHELL